MTTGERIKSLRKARHISAETVAEVAGISPATVYRYENGDISIVPPDKTPLLAAALGVTEDYLTGKLESNLRAMGIKVSRTNRGVILSDDGGLFDEELVYTDTLWESMCSDAEKGAKVVFDDFLADAKKPAPVSEDELTPAQRRAWEFVKQMDDETLDRFIAAAKAFIK